MNNITEHDTGLLIATIGVIICVTSFLLASPNRYYDRHSWIRQKLEGEIVLVEGVEKVEIVRLEKPDIFGNKEYKHTKTVGEVSIEATTGLALGSAVMFAGIGLLLANKGKHPKNPSQDSSDSHLIIR